MNTPDLRAIASAHRRQIIATLFLIVSCSALAMVDEAPGILPDFLTPAVLKPIAFASVVALWVTSLMLARHLYEGTGFFITCVLSTIPPINLLTWFAINSRASKTLRGAGAKVGFFGASQSSLPPS